MILTALAMAFITTLVVANIIAIKLFSFSVPIIPDDLSLIHISEPTRPY